MTRTTKNFAVQASAAEHLMKDQILEIMKDGNVGDHLTVDPGQVVYTCVAKTFPEGEPIWSAEPNQEKREELLARYVKTGVSAPELEFIMNFPEVIDALISYHEYQSTCASSIDPEVLEGPIRFHDQKIDQLRAYRDELIKAQNNGDDVYPTYNKGVV